MIRDPARSGANHGPGPHPHVARQDERKPGAKRMCAIKPRRGSARPRSAPEPRSAVGESCRARSSRLVLPRRLRRQGSRRVLGPGGRQRWRAAGCALPGAGSRPEDERWLSWRVDGIGRPVFCSRNSHSRGFTLHVVALTDYSEYNDERASNSPDSFKGSAAQFCSQSCVHVHFAFSRVQY